MIQDYLKAGYPVLLVRTHEPERFIGSGIKEANGRTAYQWDVVQGLSGVGKWGRMGRMRPLRSSQHGSERRGKIGVVSQELPLLAE